MIYPDRPDVGSFKNLKKTIVVKSFLGHTTPISQLTRRGIMVTRPITAPIPNLLLHLVQVSCHTIQIRVPSYHLPTALANKMKLLLHITKPQQQIGLLFIFQQYPNWHRLIHIANHIYIAYRLTNKRKLS